MSATGARWSEAGADAERAVQVLSRHVHERLFTPSPPERPRVGAEVERVALLAASGAVAPLEAAEPGAASTLATLRRHGAGRGWVERRSPKGAPYFALPGGATVGFEPGGQIELSTPPFSSASALLAFLRRELDDLSRSAERNGIVLAGVGIDPRNDVAAVPLQLGGERYARMAAYFDSIGPHGARMMRQTASAQLCLDAGARPAARFALLGALAPYLTAIFANSSRYAGRDTGHQSFRAHCWRALDPSRTGLPRGDGGAERVYTRFALDAIDMMRRTADGGYRSYGDWVARGDWSDGGWETHLSTLFPEVRPRGYLELRAVDALPTAWLAAPVVVVSGLTYDDRAAAEATLLVGAADESILITAGRRGLHDPVIAGVSRDLFRLGLEGARRLGERFVSGSDLEAAQDFHDRFTRLDRAPADEQREEGRG